MMCFISFSYYLKTSLDQTLSLLQIPFSPFILQLLTKIWFYLFYFLFIIFIVPNVLYKMGLLRPNC
jgi:hypothetical protein